VRFGPELLAARLAPLRGGAGPVALAVAVSGGADSVALLHACAALARREPRYVVRALHVNHALQPAAAGLEAAARAAAGAAGLPFTVLAAAVAPADRAGVEAAARAARYAALFAALAPGEALVTAHHREDQAETLLLQLVRGAGLRGLAAMPAGIARGGHALLRPLLDVPRAALRDYARMHGLTWLEDPMNVDPRFDRAWLREELWPTLTARWPAAPVTLARAAAHLAGAQALLDEHAAEDLARVARGPALAVEPLLALSPARRAALLRYWLVRVRGLHAPAARRLALIERELLRSRGANTPRMAWPGAELARHAGLLYAFAPLPAAPWPLRLPAAPATVDLGRLGRLELEPCVGSGLAVARGAGPLELRTRAGGERLQLAARGVQRELKDLLREARLPPWTRARVALVYAGAELLGVVLPAATWVGAQAAAGPGEPGVAIRWRAAPEELAAAPAPAAAAPVH